MSPAFRRYIRGVLATAGFAEIAVERAHSTIIGGSPEEEARQALMMGPTARLIEEKKPAEGQSDPATSDHLLVTAPPSLNAPKPQIAALTEFLVLRLQLLKADDVRLGFGDPARLFSDPTKNAASPPPASAR